MNAGRCVQGARRPGGEDVEVRGEVGWDRDAVSMCVRVRVEVRFRVFEASVRVGRASKTRLRFGASGFEVGLVREGKGESGVVERW